MRVVVDKTTGLLAALVAFAFVPFIAGCGGPAEPDIVVYTALDSEFSQPVLDDFAAQNALVVAPKFDTEANKTVGLANAILAEAARPRCDVFWNNEILNTLRLEKAGLLLPYEPPAAKDYPAMFRSSKGLWHGFAARARVLIVNTDLVKEADRPTSILDLTDARWKGRCGIAKPLFGTTATHAACLFAVWGDERTRQFFHDLQKNEVQVLPGNKQVATNVAAGRLAFGLTDTDDAVVMIAEGHPVAIVYPDQGDGGLGTLLIPNTLAIIKGCPHETAAKKLVDQLLSADVESRLAAGESAQIPLGKTARPDPKGRVESLSKLKGMEVDFSQAADQWETSTAFLRTLFVD
ncbi:MAG: extracellular solute-binding protein [Planctomycetia bacterium]|nr:extracellular solute-binding protein [Planctomycetia bacterium]